MARHTNKFLEKYNWIDIQKFYDDGNSWNDVLKKFNINSSGLDFGLKSGLFKTRSRSESNKMTCMRRPRKLSEETKKKISESRIKYLLENPDKVPYRLNHSSKESYPEKYFTELFKNENIKVTRYHYIGLYELDFCILDKKIDIEIDGEQHHIDKRIVESDKRRTEFLENLGWTIFRIRWSEYNNMRFEEKIKIINKLKDTIGSVA